MNLVMEDINNVLLITDPYYFDAELLADNTTFICLVKKYDEYNNHLWISRGVNFFRPQIIYDFSNSTFYIVYNVTNNITNNITTIDESLMDNITNLTNRINNLTEDMTNIEVRTTTLEKWKIYIEKYINGLVKTMNTVYKKVFNI